MTASRPHQPDDERAVPTSTYRLQVQPAFTFAQAADVADYLVTLGVSHVYFSPVLEPAPGSTHGYDVIDHDRFNTEAGGARFAESVAKLRETGLGVVVDVVPNHMTTPTPAWLNRPWWSLLREGRESPFAHWFDVDWDAEQGAVLVPILGTPLVDVVAAGELVVDPAGGRQHDEPVLRYHDHEFPLAPGTDRMPLAELLEAQCYRLCFWREGGTRLNYRRFFDVTSLIAIRVEDPEVFAATHRLLLDAFGAGLVDGFRIDHPDGLADPGGYLARLADATGDAWVVVEKILEGDEPLLASWRCAGTTGYDTLQRVGGVFVDPRGAEPLDRLLSALTGEQQELASVVARAKALVVDEVQAAEVNRLMRLVARILPHGDPAPLRRALGALLVSMDRYRAYLVPGQDHDPAELEVLARAESRARLSLPPADHEALADVAQLARGALTHRMAPGSDTFRREFVVRFQQTCGPVMAKGIEDTAFYRYPRLTALNEVGGDPGHVGVDPAELHTFAERQLADWPSTMTTLTTHDTKRSEDVRARLAVLSELPGEWGEWVTRARELAAPQRRPGLDAATEYLLWQTAVGAWPIDRDRLQTYATKAIREAKLHTTWTDEDPAYEAAVGRLVTAITEDPGIVAHLDAWTARTATASRSVVLGQKLLQLVVPGVPDVYQGTELVTLSLVDPDNRGLVDYGPRRARLARLDAGAAPADLDDEKLLVTSRTLRLRRDHPEWFTGPTATYAALPTSSAHAVAVARGGPEGPEAVAVVTRLPEGLARAGGWDAATVQLPAGTWRDLLTGRPVVTDSTPFVRLAELLSDLPVALIVRDERA
jgi:(1->4)-alpha-D-glucan 1-alpha-D-glucosylmutase